MTPQAIRSRRWRERHPGNHYGVDYKAIYRENQPSKALASLERFINKQCRLYDIPRSEYDRRQLLGCEVCGQQNPGIRRLALDHDHQTGKLRGLLCSNCNTALGLTDDDPDRLRNLAAYLEDR